MHGKANIEATSRRERNKLRTRANILSAARSCFSRAGIGATTMDAIAERADVARGTLFNYFPSKAEIVSALVSEKNDAFIAIVAAAAESDLPLEARVRRIFGESAEALESGSKLARSLLDPSEQGWAHATVEGNSPRAIVMAFADMLASAPDFGAMRRDVAPEDMGELLLGIYSGIITLWRFDEAYPLAEKLDRAARLFAAMLAQG